MSNFLPHRNNAYGTAGFPQKKTRELITLLVDSFTDTDDVLLKNHTPVTNNTGDVWHDANDNWKISGNELVKNGGDVYSTRIDLGKTSWRWTGKIYIPAGDCDVSILFRSNGTAGRRFQIHSSGHIWVRDFGATVYTDVAWTPQTGWIDFEIVHNSAGATLTLDATEVVYTGTTLNTQKGIGMSNWSGCSPKWDNFTVEEGA